MNIVLLIMFLFIIFYIFLTCICTKNKADKIIEDGEQEQKIKQHKNKYTKSKNKIQIIRKSP